MKKEKKKESFSDSLLWKPFTLNVSMVLLVFILGVFMGIFVRNRNLVRTGMLESARYCFQNIVVTRRWNAGYGGVFVEKKKDVISNPYLENPDIRTTDGKTYTKKNPALMTREISEIAARSEGFTFHITSLKPLNPANAADEFETRRLLAFEKGLTEDYAVEKRDGRYLFLYMAPLVTEKHCLECHAKQGYREGQIRGGISVRFDITDTENELRVYNVIIIVSGVISFAILFGIIFFLIKNLMRRLSRARSEIERLAVTDELTGLHNRRYFFLRFEQECDRAVRYGKNMAILMMDVDNFKNVNDTYGHLTGDLVLKKIASIILSSSRTSDIVARYGGEEFIMLIPETGRDGALVTAEKIRKLAEKEEIDTGTGARIRCTLSLGLALFTAGELESDGGREAILKKADDLLYQAKNSGKNRVMSHP